MSINYSREWLLLNHSNSGEEKIKFFFFGGGSSPQTGPITSDVENVLNGFFLEKKILNFEKWEKDDDDGDKV